MARRIAVKICGLTDSTAVHAAVDAGADFLGIVFFDRSPRFVEFTRAAELLEFVPKKIGRVGLFVDPTDTVLDSAMNHVRLDYFQLHGTESPDRIEAIRLEYGMPVIKALGVGCSADLDAAEAYAGVADRLLFDAKPPADASRPGGNAQSFDWTLLAGRKWPCPWFLAGGLTADTVADAIAASGARAVDVSSSVESSPGVKDPEQIARFIKAAKGE
jgi:phosphoribosylanthranilate isomerase